MPRGLERRRSQKHFLSGTAGLSRADLLMRDYLTVLPQERISFDD